MFSIEIHFGLTEFRARIKWNDKVRSLIISLQSRADWYHRVKSSSKSIVLSDGGLLIFVM